MNFANCRIRCSSSIAMRKNAPYLFPLTVIPTVSMSVTSFSTSSFLHQEASTLCSTSRRRWFSTGPPSMPEQPTTLFDSLDQWYTAICHNVAGGFSSSSIPSATDHSLVDTCSQYLEGLQLATGTPWFSLIFSVGAVVRFATLYFSFYSERATSRMQCALPELTPLYKEYEGIYNNPNVPTIEVQKAAARLHAQKKALYVKHKTSNVRALAPLLGSPIVLFGFSVVNRLVHTSTSIDASTSAFLWCPCLTATDPFFILPVVSIVFTLLNFELSVRSRQGQWGKQNAKNASTLLMVLRGAAVVVFPVVAQLRASTLLYWLGISSVSLLQPLLMKASWFQRALGIPNPPPPLQGSDSVVTPMNTTLPQMAQFLSNKRNYKLDDRIVGGGISGSTRSSAASGHHRSWKKGGGGSKPIL